MRQYVQQITPPIIKRIIRRIKAKFSYQKKSSVTDAYERSSLEHQTQKKTRFVIEQGAYQYEFAMFTCSFERDIFRCLNAYQSFETYVENADNIPYYICVPEQDSEKFINLFSSDSSGLKKQPIFLTERQLLELANEPTASALTLPGYYLQDVLRLSFGRTGIARHYFMNDSDGYFIKPFDINRLYKNGKLGFCFHEVWHKSKSQEEMRELVALFGVGHGNEEFIKLNLSYLDIQNTIKALLDSDNQHYHNFTCTPCAFDSDVTQALLTELRGHGVGSFTNAIRIVPFAFQFYGEFLSKIGMLDPLPFLFFTVEPHVKRLKIPYTHFNDPEKVGIQYQSVDYSSGNGGIPHDRVKPEIIYVTDSCDMEMQ